MKKTIRKKTIKHSYAKTKKHRKISEHKALCIDNIMYIKHKYQGGAIGGDIYIYRRVASIF